MNDEPTYADQYNFFHKEVFRERTTSKITVDYYGRMAAKFHFRQIACNFIALVSSSSAVLVFVLSHGPYVAAVLALVATIASILNIVSGWSTKEHKFLLAQTEARFTEAEWDVLWRTMDSEFGVDLGKVKERMDELSRRWTHFEQYIQPHVPIKKIVIEIQHRIERGLEEEVMTDVKAKTTRS